MWKRSGLLGAAFAAAVSAQALASDGPFVITNVSSHGQEPVTIWKDPTGYAADIGAWPDVANFGCSYVYVDIDVRGGGTLTGTYNVREIPQVPDPDFPPYSDSYLSIYLLEPGVTWDPGTTWNESGTEICWRNWEILPGVVWIDRQVDTRAPDCRRPISS